MSITIEELRAIVPIFNESNSWELPDPPLVGMIGCFAADRVEGWSPFIVIAYTADTHEITVARPRMRFRDVLEFGEDTVGLIHAGPAIRCTCDIYYGQGGDAACRCGANELEEQYIRDLFTLASPGDTYKLETFVHMHHRPFDWIYHQHMMVGEVNNII